MRFMNTSCPANLSNVVGQRARFSQFALWRAGGRLALLLLPLGTGVSARADGPLLPVHVRVGGREVVCKLAPLADNDEMYVPLEALPALGLEAKIDGKGETARITILSTRQHEDLAIARPNGKTMLALFDVARLLNAHIVRTEKIERDGKPIPGSKGDTIYLLARITDTTFNDNVLRVTTSFPVPFHVHPADAKNPRGYVECVGAESPTQSRAASGTAELPSGVQAQQYSIDTARVSVMLPAGLALKAQDMGVNPSPFIVVEAGREAARTAPTAKTARNGRKATGGASGAGKNTQVARGPDNVTHITVKKGDMAPASAAQSGASASGAKSDQGGNASVQMPGSVGDKGQTGQNNGKSNAATPQDGKAAMSPPPTPDMPGSDNTVSPAAPPLARSTPVRPSLRGKSPSRAGSPRRTVPVEVRGLALTPDGDQRVHLDIATSDSAGTYVHYLPGGQLAVDIPNATLHLGEGASPDQLISHPLLNGIHAELLQDSPPVTRITCDTTRIVGFTVNTQSNNKITVDLRLPRSATGVLADKVIVIDAGHGGSSTGATGGGYMEKNITLQISLKLRDILESCGAKVVMTRDKDVDVNLYDRPNLANDIHADLFVSIHNDSFTSDSRGTSTYYHMSDPSSRALANVVQQAIVAISGIPSKGALSDGILYNSGLAVLRASNMPAILVEVAYISNTQDRKRLIDSDFQQRVAQAVCDGLRAYVEGGGSRQGGRRMGMDNDNAPPLPGDENTQRIKE